MKENSYFCLPEASLQVLADNFGTPLLVLSLKQIEDNYLLMKRHMPRVNIHYAVKANPDRRIVEEVARLGGCFDVASDGEINELYAMGIDGSRMLYANPFKTQSGLEACKRAGVNRFTFDSASEVKKLAEYAPGAQVLVRVRADNTGAVVDLNKKFGADPKNVLPLLRMARDAGLDPVGICFHVGSQLLLVDSYIKAIEDTRKLFDEAEKEGFDLKVLDIGGGYPVPSVTEDIDFEEMFTAINDKLDALFPNTEIWSEPGRFICATAVNMITKVIGITERNNQPWYILDDGVYGVFSGVLFDHWDYEMISYKEGEATPSTFAGPSCDSLDVICCDSMTAPLEMDDLILVTVCGAYSSASATTFNGFTKAKSIVWEDVKDRLLDGDLNFALVV